MAAFPELVFRGKNWVASWPSSGRLLVAGNEDAPHPAHLAAARALVARWDEVERAVREYLLELVHVRLDARPNEGFAAEDCGFEGELFYEALAVTDPEQPSRARLIFYTGHPDGYVTYELTLEEGLPASIRSYCS